MKNRTPAKNLGCESLAKSSRQQPRIRSVKFQRDISKAPLYIAIVLAAYIGNSREEDFEFRELDII